MIKSNSIPIGWVIHRLENNNIKEVLAVLWRFLTPCRLPSLEIQRRDWESPGNLAVRVSGIWLALAEDWGKQTLQSWTAETKFCRHQEPEKRISDPIGDWTKTTCKYWRASCGDVGQQGLTTGLTTLRACPQGWGHQKVSLPIEPVEPKAGSPQVKQLPGRELPLCILNHPCILNLDKSYLIIVNDAFKCAVAFSLLIFCWEFFASIFIRNTCL